MMTSEVALVLTILGIAIALFATEQIRVDVISMMVLLSLSLYNIILSVYQVSKGWA